jgi:hypothetical protein
MRTILLLSLLLGVHAYAEDCTTSTDVNEVVSTYDINTNTPNYLKGAKIIVRLANGKESSVPAEKFKVVPRKQQYITKTAAHLTKTSCTISTNEKNRVALLGGRGAQNGLDSSTDGTTVSVASKVGLVGGLQYQRLLGKRVSLGIQGQTNKTLSGMIGLDF